VTIPVKSIRDNSSKILRDFVNVAIPHLRSIAANKIGKVMWKNQPWPLGERNTLVNSEQCFSTSLLQRNLP